jgi:hypothetical protein
MAKFVILSLVPQELRHRNIVEVKGIIESPLSLVLEFVPLGSLVQYEREYQQDLTEEQLLQFSLDVAEVPYVNQALRFMKTPK